MLRVWSGRVSAIELLADILKIDQGSAVGVITDSMQNTHGCADVDDFWLRLEFRVVDEIAHPLLNIQECICLLSLLDVSDHEKYAAGKELLCVYAADSDACQLIQESSLVCDKSLSVRCLPFFC
jgi:hypothetical protein